MALLCFITISLLGCLPSVISYVGFVEDFEIIKPRHIGGRFYRDLSAKSIDQRTYFDVTRFEISGFKKHFTVHLKKSRYLIPSHFVAVYQDENGDYMKQHGLENCYYVGHLGNEETTSVTMETCFGLKGLLKDSDGEEYFIEPHVDYSNATSLNYENHVFYNMKSVRNDKVKFCGGDHHNVTNLDFRKDRGLFSHRTENKRRKRRSANEVKYIEAVVVLDRQTARVTGSVSNAINRGVSIMHYVDGLYKTLNTRVVLIGVVVWNTYNMIRVSASPGETLGEFRAYTRYVLNGKLQLYPDNAQFITQVDFTGSIVGLAGIGVMCSVTSCAVNQDHHPNPALVANTVTHEMGHNIGFVHNDGRPGCECETNGTCVMGAIVANSPANVFAPCVRTRYADRLSNGELPCLFNFPSEIYGDPTCGDGFIEGEEECDCGSKQDCEKSGLLDCCDPRTCKLRPNAQCASGSCCDKCQLQQQGTLCRKAFNVDCDLPEYCNGVSNECPRNVYVKDGLSCNNGLAFCYEGSCRSHESLCNTIWGANATRGWDLCFDVNKEKSVWGNCGQNDRMDFIPCEQRDRFCGKVQCREKSSSQPIGFPHFGNAKIIKTYYIGGNEYKCHSVRFDNSGEQGDPSLSLDGTKCGDNSVCYNHKCINMSLVGFSNECPLKCENGGVCNNNGNCHCPPGYACPYCKYAGPGGSFDSGQGCVIQQGGTDECFTPLVKAMLVLFLLVLPVAFIIIYLCYRHQEKLPSRLRFRLGRKQTKDVHLSTRLQKSTLDDDDTVGTPQVHCVSSSSTVPPSPIPPRPVPPSPIPPRPVPPSSTPPRPIPPSRPNLHGAATPTLTQKPLKPQ